MNIKRVVVGPLMTNCYILELNDSVLIIDPGDNFDLIRANIDEQKLVVGVVITHSHFDHIGALEEVMNYYHVKKYDMKTMCEGVCNIGPFKFETIYTKGHYFDSITLYFKDINTMFVGDFIFRNSIGRVDLEGASTTDMIDSINKILNYPNAKIMPGHGWYTTLDEERTNLKYFIKDLECN